jgi:hypothetical protein
MFFTCPPACLPKLGFAVDGYLRVLRPVEGSGLYQGNLTIHERRLCRVLYRRRPTTDAVSMAYSFAQAPVCSYTTPGCLALRLGCFGRSGPLPSSLLHIYLLCIYLLAATVVGIETEN